MLVIISVYNFRISNAIVTKPSKYHSSCFSSFDVKGSVIVTRYFAPSNRKEASNPMSVFRSSRIVMTGIG